MWLYWRLFVVGLGILGRRRRDLILENLILRQQLAVWERSGRRPRLAQRDRQFWSVTARRWNAWRAHLRLVQPATVVGGHRLAWRRYWRRKSRGAGPGRAPIDPQTRQLIARLAAENPAWGVRRIAAELAVLGHPVSPATVYRYRGTPAPSPSWRTFLRLHAPDIWAADFFTVQTLTFQTLYAFFVISHDRRRIVHWNVTTHPKAPWVWRQILAATPWNRHPRFLIRDRDRNYGGGFVSKAAAIGITTVLTPVRAPKANAIAERVIGTIRRECLDHLIVLNERHLRRVLREYLAYYDAVRPHQSLGDEPPAGPRRCHGAPSPNASSVARFSAASTMSTPGKRPDGVLKHHRFEPSTLCLGASARRCRRGRIRAPHATRTPTGRASTRGVEPLGETDPAARPTIDRELMAKSDVRQHQVGPRTARHTHRRDHKTE